MSHTRTTASILLASAALIFGLAQAVPPAPARASQSNDTPREARRYSPDIALVTDVAYANDNNSAHRLDLYLPAKEAAFPVVVFVHGGCWNSGDKNMYAHIGRHFASRGVGVAVVGYRLSPAVAHPGHIEDVAAGFAWVHKNIATYGGDPQRLFLAGHSAGGHMVALLATDGKYLAAHGLSVKNVRGVVAISGVYSINYLIDLAGLSKVFAGSDRNDASPISHAAVANVPPFLILYAEKDLPTLGTQAQKLQKLLSASGNQTELQKVAGHDHKSIIIDVCLPESEYGQQMIQWVKDR